tara:strand:+ start:589 stop:1194 length:606 start_codon:yes stop_codon:yes gene_type:complete
MATPRGAWCESCYTSFEQGNSSVVIANFPDGKIEEYSVNTLMSTIEKLGGISRDIFNHNGEKPYEAHVKVSRGNNHKSVRWKGRVIGFFEHITEHQVAILKLKKDYLTLAWGEQNSLVWPLENLTAIQISSKAIQINIRGKGLYQIEFVSDSPRRWEDLLQCTLYRFYKNQGQRVIAFQPRIITETSPPQDTDAYRTGQGT